jgi:hypothetical protein
LKNVKKKKNVNIRDPLFCSVLVLSKQCQHLKSNDWGPLTGPLLLFLIIKIILFRK